MKAAIDIGTNSCRLLIMEQKEERYELIYKDVQTTRIGADGKRGESRTIACLQEYRQKLDAYGVEEYRVVATAALRESSSREAFISRARKEANLQVEVIDGEEEAWLSYNGATRVLGLAAWPLLADVGGGSSEFICPQAGLIRSIPVGAVKVHQLGLQAEQIEECFRPLLAYKESLQERPLVFVGGTATSLAAIKLGMEEYDAGRVNGQKITRSELEDLYDLLQRMPIHLRRRLPGLQPERADIIDSGALILLIITRLMEQKDFIVSDSDLLQGIIYSL